MLLLELESIFVWARWCPDALTSRSITNTLDVRLSEHKTLQYLQGVYVVKSFSTMHFIQHDSSPAHVET
jgi:hypothetical protein